MKNKSFLLITISLLLTGCVFSKTANKNDNSESQSKDVSSSENSDSQSSSSNEPSSEDSSSISSESEEPLVEETYDYDGYYADLISWKNGADLKQQLHDIIHGEGYNPVPYKKSSGANNYTTLNLGLF